MEIQSTQYHVSIVLHLAPPVLRLLLQHGIRTLKGENLIESQEITGDPEGDPEKSKASKAMAWGDKNEMLRGLE